APAGGAPDQASRRGRRRRAPRGRGAAGRPAPPAPRRAGGRRSRADPHGSGGPGATPVPDGGACRAAYDTLFTSVTRAVYGAPREGGGPAMRITSVGGGPAGLYAAILVKAAHPDWTVTVLERNQPDDTFGFGVVFSEATLAELETADPTSHDALVAGCAHW